MLEPETSFRKAVHDQTLKSPTSAGFDAKAWKDAFTNATDKSTVDGLLAMTGLWISVQASSLRQFYGDLKFDRIGSGLWVVLAIAFANREFRTAADLQRDYYRGKERGSRVDTSYEPLLRDVSGKEMHASGFNESLVDALESWMFDLREGPTESLSPPDNLWPSVYNASMRMSIQRELNRLWNQASWEGYHVDPTTGRFIWEPDDFQSAQLLEATIIRHEEYSQNLAMIDLGAWPSMSPAARSKRMLGQTVTKVTKHRGGPRKILIGKPSANSKSMDHYAFERAVLEGSYLESYMDRPMPRASSLTASVLLQAWHVLVDFAMATKEPLPEATLSERDAVALAALVKRGELVAAFTKCLQLDESTAEAIIRFLTFELKKPKDKGHRGFWSAPLVRIPGQERYALCVAALLTSNPLRKVEAWLEKGGIDDTFGRNARGDHYEMALRESLHKKIHNNSLLTVSRCAEHGTKKTEDFPEQIDLLI